MSEASAQRAQAARLLHRVVAGGRTTDQVLAGSAVSPLVLELLLGSLRHYFSLTATVDRALHRPLRSKDLDLKALMIVGAYQLAHLRIPDHAALHESVAACADLGKPWARGLVNAVLRKAAGREPQKPGFEHPQWLEQALRAAYPDAEALMRANNQRPPMTLRINRVRIDPEAYAQRLTDAGIVVRSAAAASGEAGATTLGPETRVLAEPRPVSTLPGYREGLVSVQDGGGQFAAALLAPGAGQRVLDACAAPGGKLFHLRERCPGAGLVALDRSAERLERLRAEAERLGHDDLTTVCADAATLDWWDGVPFQRVLLDAPCSGTGTLRRHPDIKILRRAGDIEPMTRLQGSLLASLWRVLEPGGTLLYCTCSILAAENDEVISRFLARQQDAAPGRLRLASGRPTRFGWQLLPTDPDTDGFYYALMTKGSP